jgi:hypothetical protein
MFRIFIFNLLVITTLFAGLGLAAEETSPIHAPKGTRPTLTQPLDELFSHSKHKGTFDKLNMTCTDCHKFSVHGQGTEPLSEPIRGGYLRPYKQVCHQCHLGNVSFPRPNQCQLCHSNVETLRPDNHYQNWIDRHGRLAQMDRDSCAQCHTSQSCAECHIKRNSIMPIVHPPNWRMLHSIEARGNPQKCTLCHQDAGFCVVCHSGKRQ